MNKFLNFRDKLTSDGKLAAEYGEIIRRRGIAKGTNFSDLDDSTISEIIQAAVRAGFDFTIEEVRKYFASDSQDELSDAELESVAGGKGGSKTTLTIDLYYNEKGEFVDEWTTSKKS
ncbi:MAG: Nif11-like leader peptide family RiPP precursor [Synergistaceae bacterium]|nr:Nif11-like leader peptide family RiPP precursor [Synergistaceae bacterium]